MRCWDALLSEGTKIVFRLALALLKAHEELLLAQDNAGEVLRGIKLAAAAMHDRESLMKVRGRGFEKRAAGQGEGFGELEHMRGCIKA